MGSSTTSNPERVAWNAAARAYDKLGGTWDWPTLVLCHPALANVMLNLVMIPPRCLRLRVN